MKKFTEFKRIYEQEITLNQQEGITQSQVVRVEVQAQPINQSNIQQQEQQQENQSQQTNQSQDSNVEQSSKTEFSPVKLFSKLFESSEMARVYHLSVKGDTGSHAAHLALGSYYDSITEITDEIVEVYQGQYEIVDGYDVIDTQSSKDKDKIEYFKEVANVVKECRKSISVEDTHIQSLIDVAVAIIYRTIYKLKYNK